MSLDLFCNAPVYIQLHAVAAMISIVLGPVALYRKRRDRAVQPAARFGVFYDVVVVARYSRCANGDIGVHKSVMRNIYWVGLTVAGLANFLPDRRVNEAVFGGNDDLGWIVIALGTAVLITIAFGGRSRARRQQVAGPNEGAM